MTKSRVPLLVAVAVGTFLTSSLVVPSVASASGGAYTWTGNGDQHSWGDAQNWSPPGVPGPADTATIGTNTDPGPQVYVPPGTTVTGLNLGAQGFLYSGPTTQSAPSNLTVAGTFDWTGNVASNGIYIAIDAQGPVNVSGSGARLLDSFQGGELTIEP